MPTLQPRSVEVGGIQSTMIKYRGVEYQLVVSPPTELQYRGAKYVLALEDETPVEEREPLHEVRVHIPSVVAAYNLLPGVKACLDPFVALSTKLQEAFMGATFRTRSEKSGLKWIVDAGYEEKLRIRLEEDPDRTVAILDGFLGNFALMDAYADRIYELMQAARKEILSTDVFKAMLSDTDAYDRLVNSAKAEAAKYNIESQTKHAARVLGDAKNEGIKANQQLQKTTDKKLKEITSPDGTVTIKSRSKRIDKNEQKG